MDTQSWKSFWAILDSVQSAAATDSSKPGLKHFGELLGRTGVSDRFHTITSKPSTDTTTHMPSNAQPQIQQNLLPSRGGARFKQSGALSAATLRMQAMSATQHAQHMQQYQGVLATLNEPQLPSDSNTVGHHTNTLLQQATQGHGQGTVVHSLARSPACDRAAPATRLEVRGAMAVHMDASTTSTCRSELPKDVGAVLHTNSGVVAAAPHVAVARRTSPPRLQVEAAPSESEIIDPLSLQSHTASPRAAKGSHTASPCAAKGSHSPRSTVAAASRSSTVTRRPGSSHARHSRKSVVQDRACGVVIRNGGPGGMDAAAIDPQDCIEAPRGLPSNHLSLLLNPAYAITPSSPQPLMLAAQAGSRGRHGMLGAKRGEDSMEEAQQGSNKNLSVGAAAALAVLAETLQAVGPVPVCGKQGPGHKGNSQTASPTTSALSAAAADVAVSGVGEDGGGLLDATAVYQEDLSRVGLAMDGARQATQMASPAVAAGAPAAVSDGANASDMLRDIASPTPIMHPIVPMLHLPPAHRPSLIASSSFLRPHTQPAVGASAANTSVSCGACSVQRPAGQLSEHAGPGAHRGKPRRARQWASTTTVTLPSPRTRYRVIKESVARLQQLQEARKAAMIKHHEQSETSQGPPATAPGAALSPLALWGTAWKNTLEQEHAAANGIAMDEGAEAAPGGVVRAAQQDFGQQQARAMDDLTQALHMLDLFTAVVPAQRRRRIDEQVQADMVSQDTSSALPAPPHAFPSSAAWDYLVAAQGAWGGLVELEAVIARLRRKIKVVTEVAAAGLGVLGSPALAPIEAELNITELASVRSHPNSMRSHRGSMRSHPNSARLRSSCEVRAAAAVTAAGLLETPLGSPRPCTPADQQNSHAHTPSPDEFMSPPIPECNHSLKHAAPCSSSQGQPCSPTQQQIGSSVLQNTGNRAPVCCYERHAPGTVPTAGASQVNQTQVNELWSWLENLMIEMHDSEAVRSETIPPSSSLTEAGTIFQMAHNPHTTDPPPLNALLHLVEQMTVIQTAMRGNDADAALLHAKEMLASVHQDEASLRAATLTHFQPTNMARVLHLMLRLSISLEQGAVPGPDAGFLLVASLNLVLGEIAWLLALLRLQQGPASPHLRALHATLRAHDAQAEYTVKLAARVDHQRQQLLDALGRARHAESRVRALEVEMAVCHHNTSGLTTHNAELARDNDRLTQRVAELEREVARSRGEDHAEMQLMRRSEVLRHSETFRQSSRSWHLHAVQSMSKGVQAASFGRCSNPRAIPDDEDWEYDDVVGSHIADLDDIDAAPPPPPRPAGPSPPSMNRNGSMRRNGSIRRNGSLKRSASSKATRRVSIVGGSQHRLSNQGEGGAGESTRRMSVLGDASKRVSIAGVNDIVGNGGIARRSSTSGSGIRNVSVGPSRDATPRKSHLGNSLNGITSAPLLPPACTPAAQDQR